MNNVNKWFNQIIQYGIESKFIEESDRYYIANKLANMFDVDEVEISFEEVGNFEDVLSNLCNYAYQNELIANSFSDFDILENKIIDLMMPKPSLVINNFNRLLIDDSRKATDYFYQLSKKSNYIKTSRIARNKVWKSETKSGVLDITINLSKPEKDPKEIAKAKLKNSSGYPKCLLCRENEGFSGHISHPSRITHRIVPIILNKKDWFFQYSPYSYFNEHAIILSKDHVAMEVNKNTFIELLEFVDVFEHYFIGSNADLPIVGGSILSHDHYQAGNYRLPMEDANILKTYQKVGMSLNLLEWPMSAIRLIGDDMSILSSRADEILNKWISYNNQELNIVSHTDLERHNTITPIARKRNGKFELDLVLRNNRTTNEFPMGIFHPHQDIHHIKKENIGLIEVMGLAVLPARLDTELKQIKDYLLGNNINEDELVKHQDWIKYLKTIDFNDLDKMIEKEIAKKFERCLIDAGVFKQDSSGIKAFMSFVEEF